LLIFLSFPLAIAPVIDMIFTNVATIYHCYKLKSNAVNRFIYNANEAWLPTFCKIKIFPASD